jgi:hypothetical protein
VWQHSEDASQDRVTYGVKKNDGYRTNKLPEVKGDGRAGVVESRGQRVVDRERTSLASPEPDL